MIEAFLKDLRYGLRVLIKNPAFTVVAVLALALGIGATTAIFSVVNAVLLRPLPFKDAERLVTIQEAKDGNSWNTVSFGDYVDFRERQQSFDEIAAFTATWNFNLFGAGEPAQLQGQYVSANLFSMLGVAPARGRDFLPAEDKAGAQVQVAILSHGLWQRQFGADPNIIGRSINLEDQNFTVIGVMPIGFKVGEASDLWVPLALNPLNTRGRLIRYLNSFGRLKKGVTLAQAQSDLSAIARQLEEQYPETNKGFAPRVLPLQEEMVGKIRPALFVLLGAVAFVLLIACANVANLTLVRATVRRKEIAIRTALGAGRMRLVRQLLTESLMLSLVGGTLGLLLATWGVDFLVALGPESIPRREEIGIDARVLLFALAVSFLTGLLFGIAPAWQASRANLNEVMKDGGHGVLTGASHQRFRAALIVSEIALALVLLTGAGLLIKSFARLLEVNPGFEASNVLALQVTLPQSKYGQAPPKRAAYYQELEGKLKALPGVAEVGAVSRLPFFAGDITTGRSNITSRLEIEGRVVSPQDQPEVDYRVASPSYFRAMSIPLVNGRFFEWQDEPHDNNGPPLVALINEAAARKFFPNESSLGKRIKSGGSPESPWWTIVGVVGDVRHFRLDAEPRPEVYRPYLVNPLNTPIFVVRTNSHAENLIAAVRDAVRAVDADVPISNISPMRQLISRSVAERRFSMLLLTAFASVALLLSAIGIYGVMSYAVTHRTREIGIRMALGAERRDILKMIVGQGMLLTAIGLSLGLLTAFLLMRLMTSLLFGTSATDPLTFALVALLLTMVTLLASFIPARRAMRVDPMVALRYE